LLPTAGVHCENQLVSVLPAIGACNPTYVYFYFTDDLLQRRKHREHPTHFGDAALLTALAVPAWGQTARPADGPTKGGAQGAASIPDFSGLWNHPSFPWFEPAASGPGPVTNRSRWPQQPSGAGGSVALPPTKEGVSDYDQLVGDHTNPILQPWAAEVVKKFGEMSLAGITYPNASNFWCRSFSSRTRSHCCTMGIMKCAA